MKNEDLKRIPLPVLPTEEEMIQVANRWWQHHVGINFLDWNETLNKNTFPYRVVKIEKPLMNLLLGIDEEIKKDFGKAVTEYTKLISPILSELKCEENFFIKTISRSPKDYLYNEGEKPRKLRSVSEALVAIMSSYRCFEDACMLYYLDKFYLVIRPYIDFSPRDEWRVFIENKKVIGITQYYYMTDFNYSKEEITKVETEIKKFASEIIIPNVNLNDYVADIVFNPAPVLLELNPFGLSDPCLYIDYSSFDGAIKINSSPTE